MRTVRLSRFGGPEVLECVEMPKPVAGSGEILVRVEAAGVNFVETLLRSNSYAMTPPLPMVLGVEVVGVVEELGDGLTALDRGTRVAVPLFAANRLSGGYAEYVAVEAAWAVPVPDGISAQTATALMVQGLSALHLIRRAPPEGKSVLVTAAAGGIGSLLVQCAKAAGARRVIAVASSPAKLALAKELGADEGIDYTEAGWPSQIHRITETAGVDIVYDLVGGSTSSSCLQVLAEGGELLFAALGRFGLELDDIQHMISRNQSIKGFSLLPLLTQASVKADLAHLFELTRSGKLKVLPGEAFPLERAGDAHHAIESRRTTGKVVLTP